MKFNTRVSLFSVTSEYNFVYSKEMNLKKNLAYVHCDSRETIKMERNIDIPQYLLINIPA